MEIKVRGIIHHQSLLKASSAKKPNGQRYEQKSYSINILIPENDPQVVIIQNAMDDAIKSEFSSGQLPNGANIVFKKCEGDLKGFMSLRLATKEEFTRPHVVDIGGINPIVSPEEIKIGDYAWVVGRTDAYQTGSGGVSCYLNGTLITGEKGNIPMEALSSTPTAEFMFADVINKGGQTLAPTPAVQQGVVTQSTIAPLVQLEVEPPPAPPSLHQMTATATGTYQAMVQAGWTDETLIEHGHMLPPGGVKPSFM